MCISFGREIELKDFYVTHGGKWPNSKLHTVFWRGHKITLDDFAELHKKYGGFYQSK